MPNIMARPSCLISGNLHSACDKTLDAQDAGLSVWSGYTWERTEASAYDDESTTNLICSAARALIGIKLEIL